MQQYCMAHGVDVEGLSAGSGSDLVALKASLPNAKVPKRGCCKGCEQLPRSRLEFGCLGDVRQAAV